MSFAATRMDLEMIILNLVRQGKTNIIHYHLHVKFKNYTNELIDKTATDSQT